MKILVCKNKHCQSKETDLILKELEKFENDIEFTHSSCMDLCELGPNVMTFPDLKLYGNVTVDRVGDVVSGHSEDLLHSSELLYSEEEMNSYLHDPMHRRTIKLFRWHLVKQDDLSASNVRDIISEFTNKYDVKGNHFIFPVKIALMGTTKGPDLPKLIAYLQKGRTIELLDEFLKKA